MWYCNKNIDYTAEINGSFLKTLSLKMACIDEKTIRVELSFDDYKGIDYDKLFTV